MENQTTDVNYGIDAPGVIRNLLIAGIAGLILSIVSFWFFEGKWHWLGWLLGITFGLNFVICAGEAVYMLWSSKIGKLKERERLLDLVNIKGNEKVLDVGCGRGLVLNAAARRLTTGKAIGLDIWNNQDQSGNDPSFTLQNAKAENVLEKVEIVDGDFRNMPFEDNTFDVVVSSLAIHNVYSVEERNKALSEVIRVLKPEGRFAILDFQHIDEYEQYFGKLGIADVKKTKRHYLMFPPVRVVTGQKSVVPE